MKRRKAVLINENNYELNKMMKMSEEEGLCFSYYHDLINFCTKEEIDRISEGVLDYDEFKRVCATADLFETIPTTKIHHAVSTFNERI